MTCKFKSSHLDDLLGIRAHEPLRQGVIWAGVAQTPTPPSQTQASASFQTTSVATDADYQAKSRKQGGLGLRTRGWAGIGVQLGKWGDVRTQRRVRRAGAAWMNPRETSV